MNDDSDLVEACDRYLAGLHCVLWGRAFDAHHPKGRREAAEWLAAHVQAVLAERDAVVPATTPGPPPLVPHNGYSELLLTYEDVRDLARRAKVAHDAGTALFVTHDEFRLLRNVDTKTWDAAVVDAWRELGNSPTSLEALPVVVMPPRDERTREERMARPSGGYE